MREKSRYFICRKIIIKKHINKQQKAAKSFANNAADKIRKQTEKLIIINQIRLELVYYILLK